MQSDYEKKDKSDFLAQNEVENIGLGAYSKEFEEFNRNCLTNKRKFNWTKVGTISTIVLGIITILLSITLTQVLHLL